MSKPPFKSGGPKRGGSSRDGGSSRGPSRSSSGTGARRGAGRGDSGREEGGRGRAYRDGPARDARDTRAARDERPARGGRSGRDEKLFGRNERPVRDERRLRDDRPSRTERPARGDRPFRDERPSRDGAPTRGERPARAAGATRDGAPRRSTGARFGEQESRGNTRGSAYAPRGPRQSDSARFDSERPRRKPPRPAPQAAAPTPKTPGMPVREGERIAKLLARAGIASRREAERLIIEGRVKLGEEVIETPSTVLPNLRGVTVDGNPVRDAEETRLFIFHKPSGLLTAERDPAGRPTIYTALRNALTEGSGRVMPIGRLDLNTEGLLLLTNDGEFKRQLELPATGVPRTYRARTFGDITQAQLEDLIEGIEVEGVVYGKIDANMERRTGRNQWIEMTLTEGKNREVRRVLEHLGLQVSRLIRVSYGPFRLLDLPKGMAVEVSPRDLENFRRTLPDAQS